MRRANKIRIESCDKTSSAAISKKIREKAERKKSCEIKIYRKDYTHLDNCKINKFLRYYNEFYSLTFGNKDGVFDLNRIKQLSKVFGIAIDIKQLQENGLKEKPFAMGIKEKLLLKVWQVLNDQNSMAVSYSYKKGYAKSYKYFVDKGNNGQLVKTIMNQRFGGRRVNEKT